MIVEAGPFWKRVLGCLGAGAITMPWSRVYVLKECMGDGALLYHERVHLDQIERDGALTFTVKYLYWLARYGYWDNPYEVEAFRREAEWVECSKWYD